MEKLIQKIKSHYILRSITEHITKQLKLKIFKYSKLLQTKLNINLVNYVSEYIKIMDIRFPSLLKGFRIFAKNSEEYKTEITGMLNYYIKKYNIDKNIFNEYALYFFNTEKNNYILDIYSPFFNIFLNAETSNNFSIILPIDDIKKYKLEEDYIKAFNQINLKNNYPSILFECNKKWHIHYLKRFNIDFNRLKSLILRSTQYEYRLTNIIGYDYFLKNLISFGNIINTLSSLDIDIRELDITMTDFEYINELKALKELKLTNHQFNDIFILKLNNLEKLHLFYCKNILLSQESCNKLKFFCLENTELVQPKDLLKLSFIENCCYPNAESIFDFKSFNKIKYLKCKNEFFCELNDDSLIEEIDLPDYGRNIEIKTFQKIFCLKALKKVSITLNDLNIKDILEIKGENNSVNSLNINSKNSKIILNDLYKKFTNLFELNISYNQCGNEGFNLILNQNQNSKLKKFRVGISIYSFVQFDIYSFENLESIAICINAYFKNIKDMPFFKDNCDIIFKSLKYFSYSEGIRENLNKNLLINLYNNLNKMPNLKKFKLFCEPNRDMTEFSYDDYIKFINRLFKMNLDSLVIRLKQHCNRYNYEQIKQKFPNIEHRPDELVIYDF